MSNIEFHPFFNYHNPFQEHLDAPQDAAPSRVAKSTSIAAKSADFFMHRNYEKQVNFAGRIAKTLDRGMHSIIFATKGFLLLDRLVLKSLPSQEYARIWRSITTIPASIFLGLDLIEGGVELTNLTQTAMLLHSLQKKECVASEKLNWIKTRYFDLDKGDAEKIQTFIEKRCSQLTLQEKVAKYDHLARKVLENRFYRLKNQITPDLAEKVGGQLANIMQELSCDNSLKRHQAAERAELLLQSIIRQAKNKIVVHSLNLSSIGIATVCMTLILANLAFPLLYITLTALCTIFMITRYFVEKRTLEREVKILHSTLKATA